MVKLINIYNNFNIKNQHRDSIILIGNFDGLHLGHQKLFSLAKKYKQKYSLKIGVLTFEPMPKMYFNNTIKNFRLSSKQQKILLLNNFGADFVIVKKFDQKFSKIRSSDFIQKILAKKLNAKFIFVSNNFRFGNKREGDVGQLIRYENKYNFKIVKPKPLLNKKKIVSSTLIRNLLQRGRLDDANKLLNRRWSIEGKVQKGRQIGKKIGFPTANIDVKNYISICPGVYAIRAKTPKSSKYIKGIANFGYRPTFNGKKLLLEVHLFNFSGNLYNKYLTVDFMKFIRREKKFKNVDQLKRQVKSDLLKAKKIK